MYLFDNSYQGKRVFITGHTGFKGSWLTLWLKELGAEVIGYSLDPPTTPSLFELLDLKTSITHIKADILDLDHISKSIHQFKPHVIFHLAAQPIVLHSFERPLETIQTNVMGTVNLLEACRHVKSLQAIVIITTDKCYENKEWVWGYRECDALGGKDTYSASKAMAELAANAYRCSFPSDYAPIATARAGNVIGGGDFSEHRLLPDCMRALIQHKPIEIRNPESSRPWMHVLDPLHGYLLLAEKLMRFGREYAEAWNFGPIERRGVTTAEIVKEVVNFWGDGDFVEAEAKKPPEMGLLKLNWDKAASQLGWTAKYNVKKSLEQTVQWYQAYEKYLQKAALVNLKEVCRNQIYQFANQKEILNDEVYSYTA